MAVDKTLGTRQRVRPAAVMNFMVESCDCGVGYV